jgi:hypothetical protein
MKDDKYAASVNAFPLVIGSSHMAEQRPLRS